MIKDFNGYLVLPNGQRIPWEDGKCIKQKVDELAPAQPQISFYEDIMWFNTVGLDPEIVETIALAENGEEPDDGLTNEERERLGKINGEKDLTDFENPYVSPIVFKSMRCC